MAAIAVFGAASDAIGGEYRRAAYEAGRAIALAGCDMVFGGGSTGLMGEAARGARAGGAKVYGMVPGHLNAPEVIDQGLDELIVTRDLRERMAAMAERAQGFFALPGGLGTLYEVAEILVLLQLEQTQKPLVLLNTLGAYDAFLEMVDGLIEHGFADPAVRGLFGACADPGEAVMELLHRIRGG